MDITPWRYNCTRHKDRHFPPVFRENPTFLYNLHLYIQKACIPFCENHKIGIEIFSFFVYNNPNVGVYTKEWKGVPS